MFLELQWSITIGRVKSLQTADLIMLRVLKTMKPLIFFFNDVELFVEIYILNSALWFHNL